MGHPFTFFLGGGCPNLPRAGSEEDRCLCTARAAVIPHATSPSLPSCRFTRFRRIVPAHEGLIYMLCGEKSTIIAGVIMCKSDTGLLRPSKRARNRSAQKCTSSTYARRLS